MGKWSQYTKRYCKDWEKEDGLKEWIRSVPGDDYKAACDVLVIRICNIYKQHVSANCRHAYSVYVGYLQCADNR